MSQYSDSKFDEQDKNTSWHKTFALIPEGASVLDVGCSSGTFGERLIKEKNCIVDGIEIDQEDIKKAKKRLRNVYKINVETDEINIERTYDIIFMGDVVEHLAKPIDALKKIKRLLNTDGSLVYSIPNMTHMSVRLMLLKGEIIYGKTGLLDETHLHFYNSKEIYRVFNNAGLEIVKFDYTVNDFPNEVLAEELGKLGLNMNKQFVELACSVDAAAYQFVGLARPSSTAKRQTLPDVSPLNIIKKYHHRIKREYHKNIAGLIGDRDRIVAENKRLDDENKRLDDENKRLISENYQLKTRLLPKARKYIRDKIRRPRT